MYQHDLYKLLDMFHRNGSVKDLIQNGIDEDQIVNETDQAIHEGLLTNSDDGLILTEKGIEHLKNFKGKNKKGNKNEWIEKDMKNQVARIDKNAIFVPSQNELTF